MGIFKSRYEQYKRKRMMEEVNGVSIFGEDSIIDKLMLSDVSSDVLISVYEYMCELYSDGSNKGEVQKLMRAIKNDSTLYGMLLNKGVLDTSLIIKKSGVSELVKPVLTKLHELIHGRGVTEGVIGNGMKLLRDVYKEYVRIRKPVYISSSFNREFMDLLAHVQKHNDITVNDLLNHIGEDGGLMGIDHGLNPMEYEDLLTGLNAIVRNRVKL